jgi:2-polyprenyl-6-hydroxyphenyl methylase/3-demethylubiquinone-9 3-methyltransferase
MSFDYYKDKLAAERLRKVYEIAPARVRQYFRAELDFVRSFAKKGSYGLEMGCGYGRAVAELAGDFGILYGIDNSPASIADAENYLEGVDNVRLAIMDASNMAFADGAFDVVFCIQNGLSAFHIDPKILISEAVRVTKCGGVALFSSYAAEFWPHRKEWFTLQSQEGLLGEIDWEKTGAGRIVCKDGFNATTYGPSEFAAITADLGLDARIETVDHSSVFCVIRI